MRVEDKLEVPPPPPPWAFIFSHRYCECAPTYGVVLVSRIDKIVALFCKRTL